VREGTERPITVTEGTNRLVPDPAVLVAAVRGIVRSRRTAPPEGWDGRAGERIVDVLVARAARRIEAGRALTA
jgi:UDP-N-acetylglucosamine 2-epimerase (non-hydrolysing)